MTGAHVDWCRIVQKEVYDIDIYLRYTQRNLCHAEGVCITVAKEYVKLLKAANLCIVVQYFI